MPLRPWVPLSTPPLLFSFPIPSCPFTLMCPSQELYPVHPHRMFTKGKEVATGLNITVAVNTYLQSHFATENSGV